MQEFIVYCDPVGHRNVASLPSGTEAGEIESQWFDLMALAMQLALAEGDRGAYETRSRRMVEIVMLLEEKSVIPAVKAQLGYLAAARRAGISS